MIALLENNRAALEELCRRYNVQRLEPLLGRHVDLAIVRSRDLEAPCFARKVAFTGRLLYAA